MDFSKIMLETTSNARNVFDIESVEETYTLSTLKFLSDVRLEMNQYSKDFYKGILESGKSYDIVNESFSDFFNKIKELIAKFLAFIKSLAARFLTSLNKFISSDKYLKSHEKDFTKFTTDNEFDMDGFTFTIDPNVPVITAQAEFNRSFVGLNFADLKKVPSGELPNTISTLYDNLTNKLQNGFYDEFRAKVIDQDGEIESADFSSELFEFFRNGDDKASSITVTSTEISNALMRFKNFKDTEKSTKKTKDQIDKDYESIKKKIDKMITVNKTGDVKQLLNIAVDDDYDGNPTASFSIDKESMNKLDLYIKAVCNQIIEMSNIHSLAFSAKLDALSACYKQDKQLLYKALSKIQKNKEA